MGNIQNHSYPLFTNKSDSDVISIDKKNITFFYAHKLLSLKDGLVQAIKSGISKQHDQRLKAKCDLLIIILLVTQQLYHIQNMNYHVKFQLTYYRTITMFKNK